MANLAVVDRDEQQKSNKYYFIVLTGFALNNLRRNK